MKVRTFLSIRWGVGAVLSALILGMLGCATTEQGAEPPPLMDRELLFDDPDIANTQVSPDGEFIAFIRPYLGMRNIWVKGAEDSFDQARPVTAETDRPIAGYFWSWDGRYLLYVRDDGGDENFNVYAVDPSEPPAPDTTVPPARNLTGLSGVRAFIYGAPRERPDTLYIGLNDRDPSWHDVYRLTISTGELELVLENTDRITGVSFDPQGNLRTATRSPQDGSTEILRVDGDELTLIYQCGIFESCSVQYFHSDGEHAYLVTNRGDDANFQRLTLLDLQSGEETLIEEDPEQSVDLSRVMFSSVTDELLATFYVEDKQRVYWRNDRWETDFTWLQEQFPNREIRINSRTRDERRWLVSASADTEPGEIYLFDRDDRTLAFQYRVREELPREWLASMKPIEYASSDGLTIPAYLTLPVGRNQDSLPLIVVPHGGPWVRDHWGYNSYAQFFANRGFAVLQPNFRGSAGFGKEFLDAGNLAWGDEMQDDITWGVKYLVEQGIADPNRVAIMGASYGGYATLAGLAFTPEVYAAGVSLVGPSNLITLIETVPPYWEAFRTTLHRRVGDPTTEEGRQQLIRQSPLYSADQINAPLLVIHGANDPRVKQAESDQIVAALHENNLPVAYLVAPDEGHGFAVSDNNMAALAETERFLAEHIDGIRFQESMSPEVAERLERMRVDPEEVAP
ncbi:S9 family peptidase [Marinimicrobium sp. ABcell2]|uniref:S9 family peptidase n=1 Tax=Marinimicrobium sp. ABcell2 TaxID=3069751 RepID=UPI0027B2A335|nr:S9 family peptidase [Marinimicrobium sp. ABcell2]MDQ2077871.1 S9 family peptidase [Marinimicrobium sp. ABcell2]